MIVISSGGRWNISPVSGDFDGKFGAMGIKTYPAAANFILLKSEHDLADIAMESGIALRRCENFCGLDGSFSGRR